jgi:hypothetical protein
VLKPCAFLLLAAASAAGAEFSGIWTGHMADRNGDLQDFSFRFEQHDQHLAGKMYGDNESIPITEGKVAGDTITFLVTTEMNGSITKTLFTGIRKGTDIRVTRERVGAKPEKPAPVQTFLLKQL